MGSISRTACGSTTGEEIGCVTRRTLCLWDPSARRFRAHALRDDGRARRRETAWARAAASVALVVDVTTLRSMLAGEQLTLGDLARDREGRGRVLDHRWRDVPVALASGRGRFPATAFLIAPDLLVTCRHVVREELNGGRSLANLRFLFDCHWTGARGALDGPLYEVFAEATGPVVAVGTTGWEDYIVFRVRPVPGSRCAGAGIPLAPSVAPCEWVTAIGHPFGLPMCTAGAEPVEAAGDARVAFAHLDVLSGSSGSPVVRISDQRVVGLVQSKPGWDFVESAASTIRLACQDAALGEPARFIRSTVIAAAFVKGSRVPDARSEPALSRDNGAPLG